MRAKMLLPLPPTEKLSMAGVAGLAGESILSYTVLMNASPDPNKQAIIHLYRIDFGERIQVRSEVVLSLALHNIL